MSKFIIQFFEFLQFVFIVFEGIVRQGFYCGFEVMNLCGIDVVVDIKNVYCL